MTTSQDTDSQGTSHDDCSRIVSRFERDWESSLQGGEPPTIENFFHGVPEKNRAALLQTLEEVDRIFRLLSMEATRSATKSSSTDESSTAGKSDQKKQPTADVITEHAVGEDKPPSSSVASSNNASLGALQDAEAEAGTSESIPSPVEPSRAIVPRTDVSGMSTDFDNSLENTFLYEHSSPTEATNGRASDLQLEKSSDATPPTGEMDSPVAETIIFDSIRSENNPSDQPSGPLDKADSIPGYEILGELGRGGMGVVYRARHIALNRTVALKMILVGGHAGEEQLTRFRAEAESVAQLHHPNIVEVYDIGEQRGLPFFSQEYIDGKSLKDEIDGKPQPFNKAAGMVETIARAMHYAHQHGIVHRDLKPGNVLLSKDGVLKVMDFGLAKNLESDSSQTRTGTIMGTPNYMAPEQGRGAKQVGPLADVYSLGAILYELITGRPPFLAATAVQTLTLLLNQEAVPPSQLQPNTPADLETITLKCLQKDPQKRYATAKELADDLRHFIVREPILARPVSRVERVWRWCCRNKLVTGLTATAVLLLVGLAVGGTTAAVIVNEQKNIAEANEQHALKQTRLATASKLLADQKTQEANVNALAARKAQEDAERSANVAKQQGRLALGSLNSLVTKVQSQLKDTAGTFELKQALLQTALDGLQKVVRTEKIDGYNADLSIAIVHQRMGKILEYLGRHEEAREKYQRFHQVIVAVSGSTPSIGAKDNIAITLSKLGDISLLLGDREKAGEYYLQAHDLRKEVAEKSTKKTRSQVRLATSFLNLGDASDQQEAEKYYYEALRMRKEFAENAQDSDRPNRLRDVWIVHNKIGDMLLRDNRRSDELLERAENHYREAFDIARELHARNRISPQGRQDFAASNVNIGNLMLRRGNRPESIRVYEYALQLLEPVATNDPENIDVQGSYVLLLARCRRHQEAETKAQDLRAMAPQVYRNLYNVACCYSLCAAAVDEGERKREYVRQALDALAQAIQNGLQDASYLKNDSDFDAIRNEERFKQLQLAAGKTRADQTRSAQNSQLKKSGKSIR